MILAGFPFVQASLLRSLNRERLFMCGYPLYFVPSGCRIDVLQGNGQLFIVLFIMDNTDRYGTVRRARVGEVPTHLSIEDISEGDALIVKNVSIKPQLHDYQVREIELIKRQGLAFVERRRPRRVPFLAFALVGGIGVLIGMWACNRVYDSFIGPFIETPAARAQVAAHSNL